MVVVPGSNKLDIACPERADPTEFFTGDHFDIPEGMQAVPANMAAGDMLFFNGSVIHGSYPNRSRDRFRRAFICHYVPDGSDEVSRGYRPLLRFNGEEVEGIHDATGGGPCGVPPHLTPILGVIAMSFTPEQVAQFRTEGYLAAPQFWSETEVAAIRAELKRLQRDGKLRNVATDGDGKTHSQSVANLQLCPMSPHSALFRALPFAPKVIEAIGQLIGDPVVLHLDQVFLKPARHGAGTNWHQDNAYFKISDPLKGTAMWTAVHDATVANGTIRVIPGSYRESLEHSRDPQSDHHIRCYPDESKAVPIELPAGGVVFFAYGVAHSTGGNNTDNERAGVAYHFLNADVIPPGYFNPNDAMKHPFLSGPDASDGTPEYGIYLAGTWDQEAEHTLERDEAISRA